MKNSTSTRVYISFSSGRPMNFKTIAELSGVEPTYIEIKGEQRIGSFTGKVLKTQSESGEWIPLINQRNVFEYALPVSHGRVLQKQLNKLMRTIKTPKQLGEYCRAHGIKVDVVVVIEGATDTYSFPALGMDKKFVSFLADLNFAEVGFDVYTEPWGKDGDDYKEPAIVLPSGEGLYKL